MRFKVISLIFVCLYSSLLFAGRPSDKQVIKDVMNPGIIDIKLLKGNGSYSVYRLQRIWEKGITIKRNAKIKEYPNAKVVIGGFSRYQIINGNYEFDKFKVTWNEYEGIPAPTDDEILALIKNDMKKFVGSYNWNKIVSDITGPILSKNRSIRKVKWHNPKSFSLNVQAKYSLVTSYTNVEDKEATFNVRFYRDAVTKPWNKSFISSKKSDKTIATHKYTSDEIRAMPTIGSKQMEKQASASVAGLPKINIPQFANDKEAFAYIYKNLRQGNKKQVEAMVRAMLNSFHYVKGSKVQLNSRGEKVLKKTLSQVFNGKIKFSQNYCPQIFIKHYQNNMIEIFGAMKKRKSRISLTKEGGRYERGKKVGQQYKISALEVWVLNNNDQIAQLKSWPFGELCADTAKKTKQLQVNTPKGNRSSQVTQSNQRASVRKPQSAQQQKWGMFKSRYLPISMKVFGTPKEKQKKAGRYNSVSMMAQSANGIFQMSATDYKRKLPAKIATPTHVKISKKFIKNTRALIHKKKTISVGTGKALEYLLEKGSGNKKTVIAYRIFTKGSVIYQVMYLQYKKHFDKKVAKTFFDSIQLR
ncbi:MAG: hypothetical protein HON94_12485 [Methylococcales bacterium]|nr:hypothetical protein [Methylococcales bacterium]